jgi:hypothetical protein
MKGFKPFPVLGLAIILCTMIACGGKTPGNGPAALNFRSNKLPDGAVTEPYLEAIIVTGGTLPYMYSIISGSLPPGLTMNNVGTVSGTPTAAGTYNFTVKVVDSQTPVQAYNTEGLTLVINPQLSIPPTNLPTATVAVPYSGAVTASGGVKPYTYTVTSDPDMVFTSGQKGGHNLTLNPDGTITGTPTGPVGTFTFTVQVADSNAAVATASMNMTIIGKLQGNYAFSFTGFNNLGQSFFMAGSLVADGNGNITSGVLDRNGNDAMGVMTDVPITGGTYSIGANNLGTMTLTFANSTYQYNVAVSNFADTPFILADPNNPNVWGSGVLKQQILTQLNLTSTNFAFGFSGIDAGGNRDAGAGYFVTDINGNISAGAADTNDNGSMQSKVPVTGSLSVVDSVTGRGTATLTIGADTLDYAFYVVSVSAVNGNGLVAVQTDPVSGGATLTSATWMERSVAGTCGTNFSNLCLNASQGSNPNGAVFELNAVTSSAPDVSLGVGNFDGNGNITFYGYDENNGGVLTPPSQNNYLGTYSVDPTTGRVTVNLTLNGVPIANQPVWYLTNFNAGFVVGTDPSVTAGLFEPQTVTQPITILSFFGTFYGGTTDPVLSSVTNQVDFVVTTPPPPPGNANGTYVDTFDSNGPAGLLTNQIFNGTYAAPAKQTARTAILDSNGNTVDILYLVSANAAGASGAKTKMVLLNTDKNPRLSALVH